MMTDLLASLRLPSAARLSVLIAIVMPATAVSGVAWAGPFETRYGISIAGLPVGSATMSGAVNGSTYSVTLRAQLTGVAGAVTSGRGAADVSGSIAGSRLLSNGYALSASNSELTRTIQMSMSGGTIQRVAINPPFEERPDRIVVTDVHRRGVVDPVSALLMPVVSKGPALGTANCNRTLPVFDGVQRFDIVLTSAGTQQLKDETTGYVGESIVCAARYRPIAGHRPNRPAVKFMTDNRDMRVWLVPVAGTKTLVPWRISVRTQVGTVLIEAEKATGVAAEETARLN